MDSTSINSNMQHFLLIGSIQVSKYTSILQMEMVAKESTCKVMKYYSSRKKQDRLFFKKKLINKIWNIHHITKADCGSILWEMFWGTGKKMYMTCQVQNLELKGSGFCGRMLIKTKMLYPKIKWQYFNGTIIREFVIRGRSWYTV